MYYLLYCHTCDCDSGRDFGMDIGFITIFTKLLVISLNYSAIADFHTLQITRAQAVSLLVVAW
jgi:hypothetical protein